MKITNLIKNQKIIIDNHIRGNSQPIEWDKPSSDLHIDKRTKYKIDGKIQSVTIKIPINSNKPVVTTQNNKSKETVPKALEKEIINNIELIKQKWNEHFNQ